MWITKQGRPEACIVTGREPTWLEQHAAEDLQHYLEKISGVRLDIMTEEEPYCSDIGRILVGRPSTNCLIASSGLSLPDESDTENDCVVLISSGKDLIVSGTNDRSVYYSACHLLETQFHIGFYYDGDSIHQMPDLEVKDLNLTERSPFRFRHTVGQWVYNFAAFLNIEEKKKELDLYARNKINSYRLYNWNNYLTKKTFQKLGVPTAPITEGDLERSEILKETVDYARKLGIEVMVYLPAQETSLEFREVYPDARYFGCEWVKDDDAVPQTVPYLYADDPMYRTLIKTFIETWIETYGPCKHFNACPPSEHHISTSLDDFIEINLSFAEHTYEAVKSAVPDARFFFDGWGVRANTPPHIWTMPGVMDRFVERLPEEIYFLDLWPNRKESVYSFREPMYRDSCFHPLKKTRYILEALNEFGGDDHMHGDFERHIQAAKEMTDPEIVKYGAGFGNCTELIGFSRHFFDLIFKLAWNPAEVTVDSYVETAVLTRYGSTNKEQKQAALSKLVHGVYSSLDSSHARYQKRCYLTRVQRRLVPIEESLQITASIEDYIEGILTLSAEEKDNPFLGRDLFDAVRQYITEYFNMHLHCMFDLFTHRTCEEDAKNRETFEFHGKMMEFLLDVLTLMVKEDPDSYMEQKVRLYSGRPCDPDVSGQEVHMEDFRGWMRDLGTTFAKSIPNLVDYPSRDYYELIVHYYHPRISACIKYLTDTYGDFSRMDYSCIDEELDQIYQNIEKKWIEEGYEVNDDYLHLNQPLWKSASRAYEILRGSEGLSLGLHRVNLSSRERSDVFASYSEDKKVRSWTTENPFQKSGKEA